MKKNKGITLIALIITLVLLSMLLTITVKTIVDNNIVQTAENAATKQGGIIENRIEYIDNNLTHLLNELKSDV